MRPLLSFLCLALSCSFGPRGRGQEVFHPPRVRIEPSGRVDLGELGPRESRSQRYTLRNLSDRPISLRLFDLSPGVTVAGPALRGPIPAFGSAELTLRVDPSDWVGSQFRNVRLGTDDPGQGLYYLPTRMVVRPDLAVDAERRTYGDVGCQESPQCAFTFTRETGGPIQLRVVTALPPYLEQELLRQGQRIRLAFTLRPERIPAGMRLGLERVQVETNAPLQPRFDLYLDWKLHHAVEVVPARLVFQASRERARVLRVRSRDGKPFRILGMDLTADGFQVDGGRGAPAAEWALTIHRRAAAPARAMLILRCSGENHALEVPLAYVPTMPAPDEDAMVVPRKNS